MNKFVANVISYRLGYIVFSDGNKVVSEMSMWYSPDKDKSPTVVELDFDCIAQDNPESNETSLEEYPLSVIRNMNDLYSSLQKESIADLAISKTKTEFAYESIG